MRKNTDSRASRSQLFVCGALAALLAPAVAQAQLGGTTSTGSTSTQTGSTATTQTGSTVTTQTGSTATTQASGAQAGDPTVIVVVQDSAPPPVEDDDPVRFRFAIALDGDVLVAPDLVGMGIGLTARVGVQFNQWVGLYYQPHGIVGGWLTSDATGVIATFFNSANIELTLPFVHIGVGPSFDVFAVAGCDGAGRGCVSGDAAFFGLDSRLALVIGGVGRGARGGFSVNAHVHPTFVGNSAIVTFALGVGGELY